MLIRMDCPDATDLLNASWQAHKEFPGLMRRMRGLEDACEPLEDVSYRFVEPKWSGEGDRLSGLGAKQFGGRWNPIGLAVVYGSSSPVGAAEETFSQAIHYGLAPEQITPRVVFAFRVKLRAVLSLLDGDVRRRLRVSLHRMMGCDWRRSRSAKHEELTQAIGRAAAAAGYEALWAPSAQGQSANLVVFPHLLHEGSSLTAVNAAQLDKG